MTEAKRNWEAIPYQIKKGQIFRELTLRELRFVDYDCYSHYIELQACIDSPDSQDNIDTLLAGRVNELRQKGKIRPISKIERQAERMANMTPRQMDWAFVLATAIMFINTRTKPLRGGL